MSVRSNLFLLFPVLALPCLGQNMPFGGGAMHVDSGTTVVLQGPLVWQLAPGAQVINDGTIDMGTEAVVAEVDGSPITGGGTETATWAPTGTLANVEPGGLGLAITSAYASGDLQVERGHVPQFTTNGTASIARWYRISTPAPTTEAMNVVLHYDLTELGATTPVELSVFEAPALAGMWTPLLTFLNEPAQTLSATDQSPTAYITAFDFDAALPVSEQAAPLTAQVWPTVIVDGVNVSLSNAGIISRIDLCNAFGQAVLQHLPTSRTSTAYVPLPALASGVYVLRVNGAATGHRLIVP